jgi:uncharacterized protein YbaA (DUF1428 family)
MHYIDGFVVAVLDDKRDIYVRYADDVPEGKLTSFQMAVKREPGEGVVFARIFWPNKATRDAGHSKMEADPRVQHASNSMPFDGRRMIYGGFQTVVDV